MSYAINRAVVIGAGTMGAAIAAHLANVGIPSYLLDIAPRELTAEEAAKGLTLQHPAVRNRIVNEGWQRCLSARPANFFVADVADRVTLGNLEDNADWIGKADWIVEAVVERLDIKQQLMARVETLRRPGSIISTNTSGIPLKDIAQGRSDDFKAHFVGTHFFNPVRYMKLLEIIPHAQASQAVVNFLWEFGTRTLGKGVVVCKDTPNFIGNRIISVQGAYTLNYALDNGYTVEEVDALTGPVIGHPKTGTYRLFDLVGVDITAHVNSNLYPAIPNDPYRDVLVHERSQALIKAMMANKWLGNKTNQGFYKRVDTPEGRQFHVLNLKTMEYQPAAKVRFASIGKHEDVEDAGERVKLLCAENDRAAQFIWATTIFGCNYAAQVALEVADDILALDNAARWGFNFELGPFETWDALGVAESVARMEAEGMKVVPWVKEMLAAGYKTFYKKENGRLHFYDPKSKGYVAAKTDDRVIVLKELRAKAGNIVADNASASLIDIGDGVLCLELHSKMNALDADINKMRLQAVEELAKGWTGMVITNDGQHFCAGANIAMVAIAAQQQQWELLDGLIKEGQDAAMAFRYSSKPIVAAPFSMVLGGGAELMMGSSAICAAAESYIGQAEAGVGLVPAMGGCKELLRRVVTPAAKIPNIDIMPYVQKVFEMAAMAKVSSSAEEARQWGFIAATDRIIANRAHLTHEAKRMVLEMAANGYRPPVRESDNVWAVGTNGLAYLQVAIWSMVQTGYASEHDALVGSKIANILCGGKLSKPQWVDPQYILDLEREAFLSLLGEQKTIDRIWHMLKTGSPLRN